jgi:hypothetical protein
MILRSVLVYLFFAALIWMTFPQTFFLITKLTTHYKFISTSVKDLGKFTTNCILAFSVGYAFIHSKSGHNKPLNFLTLFIKSMFVYFTILIGCTICSLIYSTNREIEINNVAKVWLLFPLVTSIVILSKGVHVRSAITN